MNAITLLKQDHRNVEALFERFTQATDAAARHDIAMKIVEHLCVHTAIEEEVFYPAVRREVPQLEQQILAGLEEHHVAKWLLNEITKLPAGSPRLEAKMQVLRFSIDHHVNDEETAVFPAVLEALPLTRLEDIGNTLEVAKTTAPTRPHPRVPDVPPVNVILDTALSIVDKAVQTGRDTVTRLLQRSDH